jgi:hypothetical protein
MDTPDWDARVSTIHGRRAIWPFGGDIEKAESCRENSSKMRMSRLPVFPKKICRDTAAIRLGPAIEWWRTPGETAGCAAIDRNVRDLR